MGQVDFPSPYWDNVSDSAKVGFGFQCLPLPYSLSLCGVIESFCAKKQMVWWMLSVCMLVIITGLPKRSQSSGRPPRQVPLLPWLITRCGHSSCTAGWSPPQISVQVIASPLSGLGLMSSSQWSFPRTSYFQLQFWTPAWLTVLSFASYSSVTPPLLPPSGLPSNYLSVSVCLPRCLPAPVFLGFPCGSAGKESTCNAGDLGSIPELGQSPGEGKGYPFQYSGLENSMDSIVHGLAKSQTGLSDFHFHYLDMLLLLLLLLLSRFSRVQLCVTPWTEPTRLPRPWDSPGKNTGVGCQFLLQCMKVKSESEVVQSCPTPSDPMDCSLPGSSAHGIFQARVLEWGAISFSDLDIDRWIYPIYGVHFLTLLTRM